MFKKLFCRKKSKEKLMKEEDIKQSVEYEDTYISDKPVNKPSKDRFQRWPFAKRIAQTIVQRSDSSSIVIGLYGAWGEGKTSLLNFIENELDNLPNVIYFRFNPWNFKNEDQLLHNFFNSLGEVLGNSLKKRGEKIGELLGNYADILAPISSVASAAGALGKSMSSVELNEIKRRVEMALSDGKKRVVILMDDIDRLDKKEIHAIFKLVKLTADFDYVAYILAFDEDMVSSAIAENYGSGEQESGRNFLEKIIQVPLHLPPARQIELRKICFECIDQIIKDNEIKLTQEQMQIFVRSFIDGLEPRLKTPRMAKRYSNAIAFALPILKGEVNPVDLMLIEGIRVFYPAVYTIIRDNEDAFLGRGLSLSNKDQIKENIKVVLNNCLDEFSPNEKNSLLDLLKELFPRLKTVYRNIQYGSDWDLKWAKEQRIASHKYFSRYFSYSVPVGDISDLTVGNFLDNINDNLDEVVSEIKELITRDNVESYIAKIRRLENQLNPQTSKVLSLAIARVSEKFPNPEQIFDFTTPFSQAAILVSKLIKNLSNKEESMELAKEILKTSESISFAVECFRWMKTGRDQVDEDKFLTTREENDLGLILVGRIKKLAEEKCPLYKYEARYAKNLFALWDIYGNTIDLHDYLESTLKDDPQNVIFLLNSYLNIAQKLESGITFKGDFERKNYNLLDEVINTDKVMETLYSIYGEELDDPQFYFDEDVPISKKIAHQFTFIYNKVKEQENESE